MKKIMVCLDFSDITDSVMEAAWNFARDLNASLHLIHVSIYHAEKARHVVNSEHQQDISINKLKESRKMESCEISCHQRDIKCTAEILTGNITELLPAKAAELKPDFIMIGSRTTNAATHMIRGSVGADLLKKARIPVLLIPRN